MICTTKFATRSFSSKWQKNRIAGFALLSLALLAGPAQCQSVIVQQNEAFENPPTNTHYSPVDFAGSATMTSTSFPGIIFHAQANTTDTASGHAFSVGMQMYGPGTFAQPFVSNVFCQAADNFINALNVQSVLGAGQPLPAGFGNGIRVSNNSYVGDFGNATVDENAIRRIDYVVNNENVVFVAGAVTGGAFANQNLVWTSRNSLAVRGDSPNTPFDPTPGGGNTIIAGKRRADVWSDTESSFATGRVSGFATALIGQATSMGFANATNNQVVRSLIMTGADKSAVGTVTGPWTRDTTNNLSVTMGAGKANYAQSLSILQGGERTLQPVTAGTTANVVSSSPSGFAFGTSAIGGQHAIVINAPNGISQLTATLNWNVTQTTTGGTIDTSDTGRIFPNIGLDLRTATLSGGQFVLGSSPLPQTGLSSTATLDNVQHLFFNGAGGSLPAGTYAFVITGDPSRSAVMGFSYSIIPVPEPIGGLALLPIAMWIYRRRKHGAAPQTEAKAL
jgi:hypothetical protein